MSKEYPFSMLVDKSVDWTPELLTNWHKANKGLIFADSTKVNMKWMTVKMFVPAIIYTLLVFVAPATASWLGCIFAIVQLLAIGLLVFGYWMYAMTTIYEELKKEIG